MTTVNVTSYRTGTKAEHMASTVSAGTVAVCSDTKQLGVYTGSEWRFMSCSGAIGGTHTENGVTVNYTPIYNFDASDISTLTNDSETTIQDGDSINKWRCTVHGEDLELFVDYADPFVVAPKYIATNTTQRTIFNVAPNLNNKPGLWMHNRYCAMKSLNYLHANEALCFVLVVSFPQTNNNMRVLGSNVYNNSATGDHDGDIFGGAPNQDYRSTFFRWTNYRNSSYPSFGYSLRPHSGYQISQTNQDDGGVTSNNSRWGVDDYNNKVIGPPMMFAFNKVINTVDIGMWGGQWVHGWRHPYSNGYPDVQSWIPSQHDILNWTSYYRDFTAMPGVNTPLNIGRWNSTATDAVIHQLLVFPTMHGDAYYKICKAVADKWGCATNLEKPSSTAVGGDL